MYRRLSLNLLPPRDLLATTFPLARREMLLNRLPDCFPQLGGLALRHIM
jgi:hypothetical protein